MYSHMLHRLVDSEGIPQCVGDHQKLLHVAEATGSAGRTIGHICRLSTDMLQPGMWWEMAILKQKDKLILHKLPWRDFHNKII